MHGMMLNYLGFPCTCADEYGVMDPKRLEAKASLSREKHGHFEAMESSITFDFGDWHLAAKGRKHSGHGRCACVNLGALIKWSCQVAKKRWSLSSQAIIATNGKYKALICAALPSCS